MENRIRRNVLAAVAALAVLASGCMAGARRPLVDVAMSPAAVDGRSFEQDFADCNAYAQTVDVGQAAVNTAIAGAVLNAALGAAIGGIIGHGYAGQGAAIGAAGGGIDGLVAGAAAADARQQQIMNNCLAGRGWNVL